MTQRPGISLPELLVSIFVLGIVVVVIANLYIGSSRFTRDEQLRIDVGENAARIFTTLDPILRQGKRVVSNATINSINYTTDTETIVFAVPSIINGTPSQTVEDLAVVTPEPPVNGNIRLRFVLEPFDDDADPGNDASDSTRPAEDRIVTERVRDLYLRYNEPIATDATGVTMTVTFEHLVNQKPFIRANVLYATFRNHP